MKISEKLISQYIVIFLHGDYFTHFKSSSSTTSRELRLVVDEDKNGKFRFERVNRQIRAPYPVVKTQTLSYWCMENGIEAAFCSRLC